MALLTHELIRGNQYRPSYDLFPVVKSLSYMSHINSLRLMFLIYSTIGKNERSGSLFLIPVTQDLLKYLELSQDESPFASIDHALSLIAKSPIRPIRRDQRNNTSWFGISWFLSYVVSEKDRNIQIDLNPRSLQYFPLIEALSSVRPLTCLRVSRAFPLWLYIVLTNASFYDDYWIIEAEEFSLLSMLEDKATYPDRVRLNSIPTQLLGVSPNPKMKEEERLARKEKRPIHFIPSVFSLRGGALSVLRSKSELLTDHCNIKIKGVISYFAFSFKEEDSNGISFGDTSEFKESCTFMEEISKTNLLMI